MTVRRVVIVGAGGHARVIAAILAQMSDVQMIGVADRTEAALGEVVGPTRITSTIAQLPALRRDGAEWAALAVGDNRERADLSRELQAIGFRLIVVRHPHAIVEPGVVIGDGAVICAGAILGAETRVGPGAIVNTGAIVDHEGRVGAHAHVGPGARVAGRVTIGEGTFVGAGVTIRDRVSIGEWSVIGAGAVVVADVPPGVVAYGIPARVHRDA